MKRRKAEERKGRDILGGKQLCNKHMQSIKEHSLERDISGSESARIEDESGQELSEWDRYCMEEYEQILEHDEAETMWVVSIAKSETLKSLN